MNDIKCLSKEEYKQIILHKILKSPLDVDYNHLASELERAEMYWDLEMIGLNYFLGLIIEQFQKRGYECNSIIEELYNTVEFFFRRQEFDSKYVEYIFKQGLPNPGNTLDEELVELEHKLHEAAFRY